MRKPQLVKIKISISMAEPHGYLDLCFLTSETVVHVSRDLECKCLDTKTILQTKYSWSRCKKHRIWPSGCKLLKLIKHFANKYDIYEQVGSTCGSGAATGAESTIHPLILSIKPSSSCWNFSKIAPYLWKKIIMIIMKDIWAKSRTC